MRYKPFKEMTRKELIRTCYCFISIIKRLKAEIRSYEEPDTVTIETETPKKKQKKEKVCKTIRDVIDRNPEGWFAVHYTNKKEFETLRDTLVTLDFDFFMRIDDRPFNEILNDCAKRDNYNGCFRIKVDCKEVSHNKSVQHWIENGLQVLEMSDFML